MEEMNETISALDRGRRKDESRAHNLHISPHSVGRDDVTEHRISRIYRISVFYTKLQKQGTFAKKVSVFKRKPSILVKKLYICLG